MKKFIIQNAIVNINNEKINILILENKEKLEKYILYIVNINDKDIINSSNKFEKFEFKDNISITPKKKFIDSKIEIFYNSSTKKYSLLLNKKQIYFTLNPHITLYNENIIIDNNYKLIKADSTLYNLSENLSTFTEDNLISKILNDNRDKIKENNVPHNDEIICNKVTINSSELDGIKELINNTVMNTPLKDDSFVKDNSHTGQVFPEDTINEIIYSEVSLDFNETTLEQDIVESSVSSSIKQIELLETNEVLIPPNSEINFSNLTSENQQVVSSDESHLDNTSLIKESIQNIELKKKKKEEILQDILLGSDNNFPNANMMMIPDITHTVVVNCDEEKSTFNESNQSESGQALADTNEIKIINLNSKIIPSNHETLSHDCKEIKIIEKKVEEDKEIKNIEIIKMDNVENKLKNIFDLDKIMNDFNNLFIDLSNDEKEIELPKNVSSMGPGRTYQDASPIDLTMVNSYTSQTIHKKTYFSEQNSTLLNIPEFKDEIKKDNNLLYNKLVNYQNINYKIPTIRILPTQNLNFSNLYTSQIQENNILLNLNLSIELGKDNLSYLIKIGNQKYLINKTNNSIVLTNLFNKNSQIIKNKENFKIGMLDYILYNDCTLLIQVTNQTYFDNRYGRTISVYTPKI